MRRRLLAICWDMPPQSGPRAVQVSRLLRALAPLGWESTVVCFEARSGRYFPDPALASRLRARDGVTLVAVPSPEESFFVRALWRVAPPLKHLPDEKWVWIRSAVATARRLVSERRFDRLVSFAQPWSDHLIGLRLHRLTGLPWVAHFSDPWVVSPYLRGRAWQRRIWQRMERNVVGEANALVFVTQQTADRTMAAYPSEWRGKVFVVPHGHDGVAPATADRADHQCLEIVYTGRFYDGVRTPEPLLRALAAVNARRSLAGALHVSFVGPPVPSHERLARALGLDSIVEFCGRVSHAESDARAAAADVLLLIDAPAMENLFLPSKLVEYLPFGKPVLALTPPRGASADLVRQLGYPVIAPDDERAIAVEIERLLIAHTRGVLAVSRQHADVARAYDIRVAAGRFAGILESCA